MWLFGGFDTSPLPESGYIPYFLPLFFGGEVVVTIFRRVLALFLFLQHYSMPFAQLRSLTLEEPLNSHFLSFGPGWNCALPPSILFRFFGDKS